MDGCAAYHPDVAEATWLRGSSRRDAGSGHRCLDSCLLGRRTACLLRPLAYPDAERLVRIYEAKPAASQLKEDVSELTFRDLREGTPSIEAAALYAPGHHAIPGTS